MTRPSVLAHSIRDGRRSLVGWSIGLSLYTLVSMAFYPTIKDNPQFDELMEQLPSALRNIVGEHSITSPIGYLEGRFFLLMVPLLLLIFAVSRGSDAIAGEEQRRTLEVLMSNPVTRRRLAVEKLVALITGGCILGGAMLGSLWLFALAFSMDIGFFVLLRAMTGSVLLGLFFGTLAFMIGCASGKKGFAVALSSSIAITMYLISSLAISVEALDAVQRISPFHYAVGTAPVAEGISSLDALVMVAAIAILGVGAVGSFERRDLSV